MTSSGKESSGLPVLIGVYISWAFLPLYWNRLGHVPPFEVLAHRSLWGFFFVLALLWLQGSLGEIKTIFRTRRTLFFMSGCSFSHLCSWGLMLWAMVNDRLLEISLGSYIVPLLSVFSGFILFRERPRPVQWLAIGIAGLGVGGMIVWYGSLPWVALLGAAASMVFTVCRKNAPEVGATAGLAADMLLSGPFLWVYLIWLHASGQGILGTQSLLNEIWLIGAGIVTVLPQLGFAFGLSRVQLITLSLLQYVPPTGYFLIGVFTLGEPFSPDKVFGFLCIWAGLIIFTLEGLYCYRKHKQVLMGNT